MQKHEGYDDYEHVEIVLKRPIKVRLRDPSGTERIETYESLTMREPDASDLEAISISEAKSLKVLRPILATTCNVSEIVIGKLKIEDYLEVATAFKNFIPDGLEIGLT